MITETFYLTHLPDGRLYLLHTVQDTERPYLEPGEGHRTLAPGDRYEGHDFDAWAALPDGPARLGANGPERISA